MFKFAEGLNKTSSTCLSGRVFDIIWYYYYYLKVSGLHSYEIVCISHFLVLLFYAEWSCYQCLHHGWSTLKQRLHQFPLSSNHMSPYNQKQGFAWPLQVEPHVIMYEIKCLHAPLNHTYKYSYIYIHMYIYTHEYNTVRLTNVGSSQFIRVVLHIYGILPQLPSCLIILSSESLNGPSFPAKWQDVWWSCVSFQHHSTPGESTKVRRSNILRNPS